MQEQEQKQKEIITQEESHALAPDAIYKNNIYALVDDVKELNQFKGLTDEELKNNKSFFPVLVDYIYNQYIGELLGNKRPLKSRPVYNDIYIIDDIFNIYTDLVYKYKWNNKPNILEFSILTGINTDTFYSWLNGDYKDIPNSKDGKSYITSAYTDSVRKWQIVCEKALVDGSDTIRDIFLLKAKHAYNDRNNDINITVNHKQVITSEDLPALIGLNNGNN